jgi:isochorismate synthase
MSHLDLAQEPPTAHAGSPTIAPTTASNAPARNQQVMNHAGFYRALQVAVESQRPYFAWSDPHGATFVVISSSVVYELAIAGESSMPASWWCEPFASAAFSAADDGTGPWGGFQRFSSACAPTRERALGKRIAKSMRDESRAEFECRVGQARDACRSGALEKVVLARAETVRAAASHVFDAAACVAALRMRHTRAVVFAIGDGHGGSFVGATPEILARVVGDAITSHALAGTRPCGDHNAAVVGRELLNSAKDRHEHQLVADAVIAALTPLATELNCASTPQLLRVPGMCHLETPVRGRLRPGLSVRDVANALHPTPAVCGAPSGAAKAWLAAHEPLQRGMYAGHIGWQGDDGSGVAAVGIRSMLLRGGCATLFAGAGIVAGSEPAAEWLETGWKLDSARAALRQRRVDVT